MPRLMMFLLALFSSQYAFAQGVKDPSSPNTGIVYPVNPPSQPSRPTATRNMPPASAAPPLGVRRVYRSGGRARYR